MNPTYCLVLYLISPFSPRTLLAAPTMSQNLLLLCLREVSEPSSWSGFKAHSGSRKVAGDDMLVGDYV